MKNITKILLTISFFLSSGVTFAENSIFLDDPESQALFERNKKIVETNKKIINISSENHEYYKILETIKESWDTDETIMHSIYWGNHHIVFQVISSVQRYNLTEKDREELKKIIIDILGVNNIKKDIYFSVNFGVERGFEGELGDFLPEDKNYKSIKISGFSEEESFCEMLTFFQNSNPGNGNLLGTSILVAPSHGFYLNDSNSWSDPKPEDPFGIRESFISIDLGNDLYKLLKDTGSTVYVIRDVDKKSGIGKSGRPKWKEGASEFLNSIGAPSSIHDSSYGKFSDIFARPYFANCIESDIYVSIHTNAAGGSGTLTKYSSTQNTPFPTQIFQRVLAENLHDNLVSHFRSVFDKKRIVLKEDVLPKLGESDDLETFFVNPNEPLSLIFKDDLTESSFTDNNDLLKMWKENGFVSRNASNNGTKSTLIDNVYEFDRRYRKHANGGYEPGKYIKIIEGSCVGQEREIVHRPTEHILDISPDWTDCVPDNSSKYVIPYTWQSAGEDDDPGVSNEVFYNKVPMTLIETAFHEHSQGDPDTMVLKNEYLRSELMRGVYNGILEYFSTHGPDLTITSASLTKTKVGTENNMYNAEVQIKNSGNIATKSRSGRICFYPGSAGSYDEAKCHGWKTIGVMERDETKTYYFSFPSISNYSSGKFELERVLSRELDFENNSKAISSVSTPSTALSVYKDWKKINHQSGHRFGIIQQEEGEWGESDPITFTIKNGGKDTLSISDISLGEGNIDQFALGDKPTSIAPHSSQQITVTFSPTSDGPKETLLTITSNDADKPQYKLYLKGLGGMYSDVYGPDEKGNTTWTYDFITLASQYGIIYGTSADKYEPEKQATRAEVLQMAYNAASTEIVPRTGVPGFADVEESAWYHDLVLDAKERGYIRYKHGYPPKVKHMKALFGECTDETNGLCSKDKGKWRNFFQNPDVSDEGDLEFKDNLNVSSFDNIDDHQRKNIITAMWMYRTFDPNESITRAEAIKNLAHVFPDIVLNDFDTNNVKSFPDVSSSDWFFPYVRWMSSKKILDGYKGGYFGPNDPITREQMAKIVVNMYEEENEINRTAVDFSIDTEPLTPHSLGTLYEQIFDETNRKGPNTLHLNPDGTDTKTVSGGESITITGNTHDADGDQLFYYWESTGGSFTTTDSDRFHEVTWTAPNVGITSSFDIFVTRGDGRGLIAEGSFEITVQGNTDFQPIIVYSEEMYGITVAEPVDNWYRIYWENGETYWLQNTNLEEIYTLPPEVGIMESEKTKVKYQKYILQAYLQAYLGSLDPVLPIDTGNGKYLHWWKGLLIQDFTSSEGCSSCESAIIYNDRMQRAFHVPIEIWKKYAEGGRGPMEYWSPTGPAVSVGAGGSHLQYFENGCIFFDSTENTAVSKSISECSDIENELEGVDFSNAVLKGVTIDPEKGDVKFIIKAQQGGRNVIDLNGTRLNLTKTFFQALAIPNDRHKVDLHADMYFDPPKGVANVDANLQKTEIADIFLNADVSMKIDMFNDDLAEYATGTWRSLISSSPYRTEYENLDFFDPSSPLLATDPHPRWHIAATIIPGRITAQQENNTIFLKDMKLGMNAGWWVTEPYLNSDDLDGYAFSSGARSQINTHLNHLRYYIERYVKNRGREVLEDINDGNRENYQILKEIYGAVAAAQWYKTQVAIYPDLPYADLVDSFDLDGIEREIPFDLDSWNQRAAGMLAFIGHSGERFKIWGGVEAENSKPARIGSIPEAEEEIIVDVAYHHEAVQQGGEYFLLGNGSIPDTPELTIGDISFEQKEYAPGDVITLEIDVINRGNEGANRIKLKTEDSISLPDGRKERTTLDTRYITFSPSDIEKATITTSLPSVEGIHTITATIDTENKAPEPFEDNNSKEVSITVSEKNNPPTFAFVEPDGFHDESLGSFSITWTDADPDNDADILLYYDTDNTGLDGTQINETAISEDDLTDSHVWDTLDVPEGEYFLYATISDGESVFSVYSPYPIEVNIPNAPPALSLLEPDGAGDVSFGAYTITWTDDDPDDNALISLYYDTDNSGGDGVLIAENILEDADDAPASTSSMAIASDFSPDVSPLPLSESALFESLPETEIQSYFSTGVFRYQESGEILIDGNLLPRDEAEFLSEKLDIDINDWISTAEPKNGFGITSAISADSIGGDYFQWDTSSIPDGPYYIYAVISDGVNDPIMSYSSGAVTVIEIELIDTLAFADDNLKNCILEAALENGWTHTHEVISLTCRSMNIFDLSGIEVFTNLGYLSLTNNPVTDISPLAALENLTYLSIAQQQVSDISAFSGMTKIRTLYLYENEITDISSLENLTKLEYLSAFKNQISDISALNGLTNVFTLDLSDNSISDLSPLSELSHLRKLYLSRNQISDVTPLIGMGKLQSLSLKQNQISNVWGLSSLTNLAYLNLAQNQISNINALANLVNIRSLYLYQNSINSIGPISEIKNIVTLSLASNEINNINPLFDLTKIEFLALQENQIHDINALQNMTSLTNLGLNDNQITDISHASQLTNLEKLYIYRNQISDISALANLTNLTVLSAYENQISDISPLSGLTDITFLFLSSNLLSDIAPLFSLANLATLNLNNNPNIYCTDLDELVAALASTTIYRPTPCRNNIPPTITITKPDGVDDTARERYYITWNDDDPDDNAQISLYYDTDSAGEDGILIAENISEGIGAASLNANESSSYVYPRISGNELSEKLSDEEQQVYFLKGVLRFTDDGMILVDGFMLPEDERVSLFEKLDISEKSISDHEEVRISATDRNYYIWDTTHVAPGHYYIYAVIKDEHNDPFTAYSSGTVQVLGVTPISSLTFADANLESCILDTAATNSFIYAHEVTTLECQNDTITNLQGIEVLTEISTLSFYGNQITDITPLSGLNQLKHLYLQHNQISDISPISGLNQLEFVAFGNNNISDLSPISGLNNLSLLDIEQNNISDITPLSGLINLQSLYAYNNRISDITPLSALTNLIQLILVENQISDISPLFNLVTLSSVYLVNNPNILCTDLDALGVALPDTFIVRPNPCTIENAPTIIDDGTDATPWSVYDSTPGTPVTPQVLTQDEYLVMQGNGYGNGYTRPISPAVSDMFIAQWDWNISEDNDQRIYFRVHSSKGTRFMHYEFTDEPCHYESGGYITCGLGSNPTDGRWHTFTRNLQQDAQTGDAGMTVNDVFEIYTRGNSQFDNIQLLTDITTHTISGTITKDGQPLLNATIAFTSPSSQHLPPAAVTTDMNGNYSQYGFLNNEDITITIAHPDTIFTNPTRTITIIADHTEDFTGTQKPPTIIDDGADATPWTVYDASPSTPKNPEIITENGYIKTIGNGFSNGYKRNIAPPIDDRFTIQWDWNITEFQDHRMYFLVNTNGPQRYIEYRPQDFPCFYNGSIVCGIGSNIVDGDWHTITRDLQQDVTEANSDIFIHNIIGIYTRGESGLDNIQAITRPTTHTIEGVVTKDGTPLPNVTVQFSSSSSHQPPAAVTTNTNGNYSQYGFLDNEDITITLTHPDVVFTNNFRTVTITADLTEDFIGIDVPPTLVDDGTDATPWSVYDNTPSTPVTPEVLTQDGHLIMQGNGYGNGYTRPISPAVSDMFIAQWDWNISEDNDQRMYFRVHSSKGTRYMHYLFNDEPCHYVSYGYINCGLGAIPTDGLWHTFVRNLQQDAAIGDSDMIIYDVFAIYARGNSRFDNIQFAGE